MNEVLKKLITEAYDEILQTASKAVRNCQQFTIEILKQEDPSYEAIAFKLEQVAGMIEIVHKAHPDDVEGFRVSVKAKEYAQDITNIAGAIRLEDEALLQEYVKQLDRRPFS